MSGDVGKLERLKMLFPGYRRMRHLEQRLEMLQTELLAAIGRESAAMSESVRLVRAEGHAERDSAFLRQVAAIKEQAESLLDALHQDHVSLLDQIKLVRAEGHAERDSAFERQVKALKDCAAGLEETISHGNASLAETVSKGNASLASQIERVRVEGHAERDSAFERQVEAMKERASDLAETVSKGNASLASQIERVRVEGHDERMAQAEALKKMASDASAAYRHVVTELFRNDIRCRWQIVDALDSLLFPADAVAACPICGHADARVNYETRVAECRFGGGRLERYVCPDCGAIFGPLKMMRLSPEQLGEEYRQSYAVYSESDCTLLEKLAFEALRPKKNGIYLNYGAGAWNRTTKDLRAEGYEVYDYEPYAPAETNDWVIRSFSDLEKMRFDGIFSNDLIEHLQNPVSDLKAMAGLLKAGAKMAHCSGCYEYAFEYTRFHLFFLTGDSLKRLGAAAGLGVTLGNRLFDYSPARIGLFQKEKGAEAV